MGEVLELKECGVCTQHTPHLFTLHISDTKYRTLVNLKLCPKCARVFQSQIHIAKDHCMMAKQLGKEELKL